METTALSTALEIPAMEQGLAPDEVDARLAAIAKAGEACESAMAFYLLEVSRRGLHLGFGYSSAAKYAEGRVRIEAGTAHRLIRAAKAFEKSPLLREAFERGEVAISKVDVVESKLGRGEDEVWVERARTLTRKDLRAAVEATLLEGGSEDDEIAIMVRLTKAQLRIFREAMEKCRRVAGADIGRGDALEMLSVEYLQTPVDESELDPPSPAPVPAPTSPDGEHDDRGTTPERSECTGALASEGSGPDAERAAAFRRVVIARDGWRCAVPGCGRRVELQVDHIIERSRRPDLRFEITNGVCLCRSCHDLKTSDRLQIARLDDGNLQFTRPSTWETFRDG